MTAITILQNLLVHCLLRNAVLNKDLSRSLNLALKLVNEIGFSHKR